MTTTVAPSGSLLRLALRLDAVVSAANGAAYLALAGPLADLLGLSPGLLRGVGAFLLAYGLAVWAVAVRPAPPAVRTVVAGNLLWTAASVLVVLTGTFTPSTTGSVWLLLQAAVVAGFAALQTAGLRRTA